MSHWKTGSVLALPALIAAYLVLGSGASAEGPAATTLSFKELEKGSTFTHVRNTEAASQRSNLQGDLIVFTNRVADPSGAVVGKLSVGCVTTTGAREDFRKSVLTCNGVLMLPGGSLTIAANTSPGKSTTTGAITGGTGTYANATGVYVSKEVKGGSLDTITLGA